MKRMMLSSLLFCGLSLTAACDDSPSASGAPTASGSPSPTAVAGAGDPMAFLRCLREHGVTIADPDPDVPWDQASAFEEAARQPAWSGASAACKDLEPAPPPSQASEQDAASLERLRTFAVCMREHDIEMSDPDATGNMSIGGRLAGASRDQLDNDPGYQDAYEACEDKLPPQTDGGEKR